MLFAVDDYNFFNDISIFHFGDVNKLEFELPKRIHSKQFVLVRGLDRILGANHPNKLFVCADTKRYNNKIPQPLVQRNLLKAINVQRYNFEEMTNICAYYMSASYLYGEAKYYLDDLTFLTGGVPGKVYKEMTYM